MDEKDRHTIYCQVKKWVEVKIDKDATLYCPDCGTLMIVSSTFSIRILAFCYICLKYWVQEEYPSLLGTNE